MSHPGSVRTLALTITDLAHQSAMRRAIGEHLASCGVCDTRVGEVALLTSELLTNAFEHGGARAVLVAVRCDVEITVHLTHVEDPSVDVDDVSAFDEPGPTMPPPDAERGRGLAIVDALSTAFEAWVDDHDRRRARAAIPYCDADAPDC